MIFCSCVDYNRAMLPGVALLRMTVYKGGGNRYHIGEGM